MGVEGLDELKNNDLLEVERSQTAPESLQETINSTDVTTSSTEEDADTGDELIK